MGRKGSSLPPADARIPYGSDPRHFGDLRLPGGPGPHPVVVVLHGGCWRSIAGPDYMDPLARELTRAGWATWNVEYRPVDVPGGAWPGLFRDVAAALEYLPTVAEEHPVDPGRVATLGHSAGGHLALWLAGRHRIAEGSELYDPDPARVAAAVSLGGIADLEHFRSMPRRGCVGAVEQLMVGAPDDVPDRYAAGSPARLLPLRTPQLLVSGAADPDVPVEHVEAYAARARDAGDPVALDVVAGAGHFEVVEPGWEGWSRIRERVLHFLDRAVT